MSTEPAAGLPLAVVPPPVAWPGVLPRPLTPLVGREREVAAIANLLASDPVSVVTLLGPGGVGKTRLAIAAATSLQDVFTDGVAFVDLSPITDESLVIPTIAQALGVNEAGGQPVTAQLNAALFARHLLMVLDNCEQVAVATQIAGLLASAPRLKVLATSRAPIRVTGEHAFPIPPLTLPDTSEGTSLADVVQTEAIDLFLQRARAANPVFSLTESNVRTVSEICRRVDGLPLAIELAAARLRLLSPEALLARLTDRLQLLTGGPRDQPARQQTLRDAIVWSYDLLAADERTLFRSLAVFNGGFTLEAAEQIGADAGDPSGYSAVLELLAGLVDQSLVQRRDDLQGEPRYIMLETIRTFGLEQLATCQEVGQVRGRHAGFFLALAEQARPALRGPEQETWLNRLEAEHDNLRAVLTWTTDNGEAESALRLATLLSTFWDVRGYLSEGLGWLERTIALAEGPDLAALRGMGCRSASALASSAGDYRRATIFAEQGLAIARERKDGTETASALINLGTIAGRREDHAQATRLFEEALAVAREIGDQFLSGVAAINLGLVATEQGNHTQAAVYLEESVAVFRDLGNERALAMGVSNLALAVQRQGDQARAGELFQEALAVQRRLGDSRSVAITLADLSGLVREQGDDGRAAALLAESAALSQLVGNADILRSALLKLADLLLARRQALAAARLVGAADAVGDDEDAAARSPADVEGSTAASVKTALGDARYAVAWTAGRALSADQAVAEAAQAATELAETRPDLPQPVLTAVPSIIVDLTPREREVLRLLVDGRTDREIGEVIFVTTKTASNHVANILSKLGVETRTAAAAFALRHGLV